MQKPCLKVPHQPILLQFDRLRIHQSCKEHQRSLKTEIFLCLFEYSSFTAQCKLTTIKITEINGFKLLQLEC